MSVFVGRVGGWNPIKQGLKQMNAQPHVRPAVEVGGWNPIKQGLKHPFVSNVTRVRSYCRRMESNKTRIETLLVCRVLRCVFSRRMESNKTRIET